MSDRRTVPTHANANQFLRRQQWCHEQRTRRCDPLFQETVRVRRAFWRMREGSCFSTLCKLMNLEKLSSCIYTYDHGLKSAFRCSKDSLPWPVLLLLGGFSRNHVFADSKVPRERLFEASSNFCDKMEWQVRGAMGDFESKWFRVRLKRQKTTPIDSWKYVETVGLANDVRSSFANLFNKFTKIPVQKCWIHAFAWGKEYLASKNLIPIPTDKDGGYAMIKSIDFRIWSIQGCPCPNMEPPTLQR